MFVVLEGISSPKDVVHIIVDDRVCGHVNYTSNIIRPATYKRSSSVPSWAKGNTGHRKARDANNNIRRHNAATMNSPLSQHGVKWISNFRFDDIRAPYAT